MMGALFSLPGLACYIYIFKQLRKMNLTDIQERLILTPIAILMAIIALGLIEGKMMIPMMLAYSTGIIISAFVFSSIEPSTDKSKDKV